jgi:hypothetical protein
MMKNPIAYKLPTIAALDDVIIEIMSIEKISLDIYRQILAMLALNGLTVCVSGGGAGVDKSLRAEKCLGVGKGLSKPQNPHRPLHALLGKPDERKTRQLKNRTQPI